MGKWDDKSFFFLFFFRTINTGAHQCWVSLGTTKKQTQAWIISSPPSALPPGQHLTGQRLAFGDMHV